MLEKVRRSLDVIREEQARQGGEQRHQTELLRETRIKIDLTLRRLETTTAPAPVLTTAGPLPRSAVQSLAT